MDSEDAMAAALDAAEARRNLMPTGNLPNGQYEPNLPEAKKEPTTFEYDIYHLVAGLLNKLEALGENLFAFSDPETGETELSGVSHTVKYEEDSALWVITAGRGVPE
jgi:hypothetical protein